MTKYYRVEYLINKLEDSYNTEYHNYGNSYDTSEYNHFMQVYDKVMSQINLPVDFLISVTNQICTMGDLYMSVLNKAIDQNGFLHLYQVTQNPKHKGFTMPVQLLNVFLQSFDEENQFVMFDNGTVLWEYYLEKLRAAEFEHLPKRLDSTFFFESTEGCDYYIQNNLDGVGSIFGVEVVKTDKIFVADMAIIDAIENSLSRDELYDEIRRYWKGEKTESPVMEVVFQGQFKFVDI